MTVVIINLKNNCLSLISEQKFSEGYCMDVDVYTKCITLQRRIVNGSNDTAYINPDADHTYVQASVHFFVVYHVDFCLIILKNKTNHYLSVYTFRSRFSYLNVGMRSHTKCQRDQQNRQTDACGCRLNQECKHLIQSLYMTLPTLCVAGRSS